MRGLANTILIGAIACAWGPLHASTMDDPICTDRPGKGSATCAVPKGHWQVEVGLGDWALTRADGERTRDFAIGDTAIKYGVSDTMHVEVAFTPYQRTVRRFEGGRERASGFGDVVLRAKQELSGADSAFAVAVYPSVKLPTASNRIGNGKVEASVALPLEWSLGESPWSLTASPELALNADGDGRGYHPGMAQSLGFNLSASERWTITAELWGGWDWDEGATGREATIGASTAYLLSHNVQIDGEVDFGLTRDSTDFEVLGGIAVRF